MGLDDESLCLISVFGSGIKDADEVLARIVRMRQIYI